MVFTFQSRATGDVIMLGEPAREILKLIGKDPTERRGIITAEQLPEAIRILEQSIEEDRVRQAELEAEREREALAREEEGEDEDDDDVEPPPTGMAAPVSFAQRGWPLLEMMQRSLREGHPITWNA